LGVKKLRVDKYLKVSRIIKRRTVAKSACESGRVRINDKVAKAGTEIKEGDVIEIRYASKCLKAKITSISEHCRKDDAKAMYEILVGVEDTDI
jgi:ribosomal 50S subunit-recycling heat shock protein